MSTTHIIISGLLSLEYTITGSTGITKAEAERYMKEMTRLKIDDYVINDYHVNSKKFGLGNFAENGAFVKEEFLDLVDGVADKKKWYIKEKHLRDKYKTKKVVPKVEKQKQKQKQEFTDNLQFIDWSEFSDVNILEDGVCGGKVCCISVMYEGKKYILKET